MLRHYLNTVFRGIARHKLYSLINILGLAFGMSCFILIALFVKDELSYDSFHENSDKIYRVVGKLDTEGQGERSSSCPFPLGPTLQQDHPQLISHVTRFFNFQEPHHSLKYKDKLFNETGVYLADSSLFEMFDFSLLQGDQNVALAKENAIVLTEALAKKYFGNEDPLGKILKYDGIHDLEVTGILGKIPDQSHLQFDALISFSTAKFLMGPNYIKNWVWNPCWTYILLHDGVSAQEVEDVLPEFVKSHYPDFLKEQVFHTLQPLESIHLGSHLEFEMRPNNYESTVYVLSLIGVFILMIASINYMNLATARSGRRARETGIRKVSGAFRSQLIIQYLMEAVVISLLSVVLSLAIIELMLPWFNELSGKSLAFSMGNNIGLLLALIGAGLLVGVFSGLYPALVLSSFTPAQVLKGGARRGLWALRLRQTLVVLQFVVSLVLIIGAIVIYRQLNYLREVDLGFRKEQVMMIPLRPPMAKFFGALTEQVKEIPGVINAATMNDIIGKHHNNHEFNYEGMEPGSWIYYPCLLVTEDFVETMELKLLAGRDFSRKFPGDDTLSVLINEAMAEQFGWTPEEALDQQFFTPSGKERVIGVLQNFNFVSLEQSVKPFVLDMPHRNLRNYWTRFLAIRIGPGNFNQVKASLEEKWKELTLDYPFEFFFLDDELNEQYVAQEKLAGLITVFTLLAVFIACLGLFALASFSAEQRTREIGIRKVLGASTADIVKLLCFEFLKLIFLSVLVAVPLAWYLMNRWLESFAYRIHMGADVFIIGAVLLITVALLTVGFKAVRAGTINPAKALRYE